MRIAEWGRALLAFVVVMAAALLFAGAAQGQTVPDATIVAPGESLFFGWDAPTVDPSKGGADAPTGYRLETFKETATGVTITTVTVNNPATLTAELPPALMPSGPFLVAARSFNAAGDSPRSNVLPFVVAAAPGAPGTFRRLPGR